MSRSTRAAAPRPRGPTTHSHPTYVVDDVVHYCVTNMPGAVARTSTFALNNVTLPFVLALADKGWRRALAEDAHLRNGLNVHDGRITYRAVAEALKLPYIARRRRRCGLLTRLWSAIGHAAGFAPAMIHASILPTEHGESACALRVALALQCLAVIAAAIAASGRSAALPRRRRASPILPQKRQRSPSTSNSCSRSMSPIRWTRTSRRCSAKATSRP